MSSRADGRSSAGEGTAVYYHSAHRYNIAEMRESLDAARRYYSEWFFPYPLARAQAERVPQPRQLCQGFPTNITFSEGIGFLTKSTPEIHARLRDHRARGGAPMVGQSSCRRARGQGATSCPKEHRTSPRSCWSNRPRDWTPGSTSASGSRPATARTGRSTSSAAGQAHWRTAGRYDRDVR